MARIKKLKENGATIYPATIPQAVVDPTTGKTLADMQGHIAFVNSDDAINIDNYPQSDYGTIAIWFNQAEADGNPPGQEGIVYQTKYRSMLGESGAPYVDCLTQLYVGSDGVKHRTVIDYDDASKFDGMAWSASLPTYTIDLGTWSSSNNYGYSFDKTPASQALAWLREYKEGRCHIDIVWKVGTTQQRATLSNFSDDTEYPSLYFLCAAGIQYMQLWLHDAATDWDEAIRYKFSSLPSGS